MTSVDHDEGINTSMFEDTFVDNDEDDTFVSNNNDDDLK
uniref:Uncharacterized protein n=1 Tax=Arundo donax TaxID=35708 RepID=A0A0A9A9Q5_ARUDO